ncbi:MAG: HAMP domain-containing sensor histidine kinase [Planctomycetota bacterium]|nr:HAMP domain-containing sensor histidine kinase [Planctomycetota bacterium]
MSPTRKRWILFIGVVTLMAIALVGVTWLALSVEEEGRQERIQNKELRFLTTALARMDAALTTVLAREAARPWYQYEPFYQPGPAYDADFRETSTEGFLVPSPLLTERSGLFQLYFTLNAQGTLRSPALPSGELRETARERGLIPADAEETIIPRLRLLSELVSFQELAEGLRFRPIELESEGADGTRPLPLEDDPVQQRRQALDELRFRIRLMALANVGPALGEIDVKPAGFIAYLVPPERTKDPQLLFVREVLFGETRSIQGIWVDWARFNRFLVSQVRGIYPQGRLRPAARSDMEDKALLATIPFVFEPGLPREYETYGFTPTRLALSGLWIAFLFAVLTIVLTLHKTMELSERRRRFVSAVTHELRTPLTTFCMYSEMLADGMVPDPEAHQEYLQTLKSESVRLRRIVDNVLSYARLEGRRTVSHKEVLPAATLLDRVCPMLARRVEETGMELVVEADGGLDSKVEADVSAVEQILFNLVDNACKYAAEATDRRVHLEAVIEQKYLGVTVLDHGNGIPAGRASEIFLPFRRAGETEGGVPGLGLGLALARGMAQEMGGDLRLVRRDGYGAVFALRLPLASS